MTSVYLDDWEKRKRYIELPRKRRLSFIDTGGPGPVLLMLHGFSDTSRSFSVLEPYFQEYRLIAPDLPGHGASSLGHGFHVSDFAETIDHFLTLMGISRFFLLGHSMGAMTSIELASRRPHSVRALTLISGTLEPDFGAESRLSRDILALRDPIKPADGFLSDWYSCCHPVSDEFLSFMKRDAANMPASTWHGVLKAFGETNLHHSASKINAPILCLSGSEDPLFDETHQRQLTEAFPTAQSVTLPGHGHNPHWEDPKCVSTLITEFLAEVMTDAIPVRSVEASARGS
ncbi:MULTISPECIES: alpha/beta fold hydrolase [Agrobacterium]|jgi:pimeloyl-ACP methyl ester carboxylesterase|uniref:Alpha/beta hydrolase n=1 Tax=Agrobacterium salinitolerans TaxID=1183413 RepID=A0A9X3KPG6_9HYPH|nr:MULTISPECIES: alpha/beta hydrolase [Agrobacterium]MBA4776042.1 alpha/beta hydrolase [Hyphomicrobiales bacterium]MCZ7851238.1 alpha/beta hydrolase [Agrobacterium salinitolerans]MCZ7857013.1 alpha/beta hydrolase [Agrobacterium salinitolerans]MCZ7885899.1 alpha/beta hydrolase [Agrobacterium salinitolerans]MCZ7890354.1 alpha/beta hydrolase [Agrobacterium salinitolerans]